jgi:hypothetical protein
MPRIAASIKKIHAACFDRAHLAGCAEMTSGFCSRSSLHKPLKLLGNESACRTIRGASSALQKSALLALVVNVRKGCEPKGIYIAARRLPNTDMQNVVTATTQWPSTVARMCRIGRNYSPASMAVPPRRRFRDVIAELIMQPNHQARLPVWNQKPESLFSATLTDPLRMENR